MTTQHGATIVKRIAAGRVEALTKLLSGIGDDVAANPHIPFAQLTAAHFLSWFIADRGGFGPFLFLELNVDGPIGAFLDELVARAGPGIDLIYGQCEGYPAAGSGSPGQVVEYLQRDDIGYECYYIGWRGLSVARILQERGLRDQLETLLDKTGDAALTAMPAPAVRAMMQKHVEQDATLAWVTTIPERPFLVRYRSQVLAALGVLAAVILLGLIGLGVVFSLLFNPWPVVAVIAIVAATVTGFLALLRWHETSDSVSTAQPQHSQVEHVTTRENQIVQNHFASIADVKPGLFRQFVLRSVLRLIHVLAAVSANQGDLSGITSIHFARWVVIDGGKKLLFLSNYDGSWENYLDDFIDRASRGLTAIWSNTVGFPRSRFLVYGGAEDEFLFKTLTRQSQVRSLVWYSAYPDLSVQNIQRNAAIREGLFAPMDAAAELQWLKNF